MARTQLPCLSYDELARYVDGQATSAELVTYVAHVETCETCQRSVAAALRAARSTSGTHRVENDVALGRTVTGHGRQHGRDEPGADLGAPRSSAKPDFGPRYRVIGILGKGGMGEVYRAYDTELCVDVALKLVRGDAERGSVLARFRREIALARKITSPNVLRVHDLAEHGALRFVSMEYVAGDNLATQMQRVRPLPLPRALAIFRQICVGLAAAHAQGVVHRDLKPSNVLVDHDDRIRVADFGLACSVDASGLTATGTVLGSPAYMSPEQVRGEPADERSDIYALGIILYELVAGEAPFRADTHHALMAMRLHKKPGPLRGAAPDTPAYVEAIAARCLEVESSKRYQSVRAVLEDLDAKTVRGLDPVPRWRRRAVLGAGAIAVASTIAVLAWPGSAHVQDRSPVRRRDVPSVSPAPSSTAMITVLVLGFENLARDPVFDGTLDTVLLYALRRSPRLDPVAGVDLRKLASELAPDVAVDVNLGEKIAARDRVRVVGVRGSVITKGAGFAISLHATDASTGASVFTQSIDVSALEDVVASTARLASGLRVALGEHVDERDRDRTGLSQSLDANWEFSTALAMKQAGNWKGALTHFQQAIEKDPGFSFAHAQLAIQHHNLDQTRERDAQLELALKSLDQVGERDRFKFLGDYYAIATGECDRALASYQQLLATWPKDQGAQINLPYVLHCRGDLKGALEAARRAAQDHPFNAIARANVPMYELFVGEFERSAADAQRVMVDFPRTFWQTHLFRGVALLLGGHRDEAISEYAKLEASDAAAGAVAKADLALAEGRLRDADEILERATATRSAEFSDRRETLQIMVAELRARQGDVTRARAAASKVKQPARRFAAALVQLAVGDDKLARATADLLATDIAPKRRAMAKLIEGESLRVHGKPRLALVAIEEAIKLSDTPIAHFLLARAALDARLFANAYTELQVCIARRGETAADPEVGATYRYVPSFTYYLAKAQEGFGSVEAKATYQAFLAMMREPDAADPLVADARRRVQGSD